MKSFECGRVVPGCEGRVEGETEDEVLQKAAEHAREAHGISEVPPELEQQIRACIV